MMKNVSGQKGGAKGAMRKGGKSGGGGVGGGRGSRNREEEEDISSILDNYDYSKPRPCVGLCFIKKLRGTGPIEYPAPMKERKSCVGVCHRNRLKGIKRKRSWRDVMKKRSLERRKPCVGLCFIKKRNKIRNRSRKRMMINE